MLASKKAAIDNFWDSKFNNLQPLYRPSCGFSESHVVRLPARPTIITAGYKEEDKGPNSKE